MLFKSLPLFAALVYGLAAPAPTAAPDAELVANILERQVSASVPGLGGTVASGSACGNVGPISGCVDASGASGAIPGASGSAGASGASGSLFQESTISDFGGTVSSSSTVTPVIASTASDGSITYLGLSSSTSSATESTGAAVAIGREGFGGALAGIAVGGLLAAL